MERLTPRKLFGASLTVAGALCLVLLSADGSSRNERSPQLGQVFFAINCLASSLEVVLWRRLLRHATSPLAHFAVMAESYLVAACLMAIACVGVSFSPAVVNFFCPECHGSAWHLPPPALLAIGYSVVVQTIVGYLAQAWALRYAESSLASLYATAQSIMAAALCCLLLALDFNPGGALKWPGREMLGGVLIVAGLLVAECDCRRAGPRSPHGRTRTAAPASAGTDAGGCTSFDVGSSSGSAAVVSLQRMARVASAEP